MQTWLTPRPNGEHGAVAIIVAIMMVVVLGMAALVLDVGNKWQTRRRLITSTDAAALAAARAFAYKEDGCAAAADYLKTNDPKATLVGSCQKRGWDSYGYVTISATHDENTSFGKVLGVGSTRSHSTSSAQWGTPQNVTGILPFGVCVFDTGFYNYSLAPKTIQTVTNFNPQRSSAECANGSNWSTPGDWATIAVGPKANTITASVVNTTVCGTGGFANPMVVGDWVRGDVGNIYQGIDGRGYDGQYALDCMYRSYLSDPNRWYGMAVLSGSKRTADNRAWEFQIAGFVGIQVTSNPVPDPSASGQLMFNLRYFQFPLGESPCCKPDGQGTAKAIRLCAVDSQDPAKLCLG